MTTNIEVAVIDAEVVEVLDETAARKLDGRIRVMAGSVRDQVQTLARLIDQAKAGEVHAVLGYPSWTAYIADVFSSAPLHLKREQRRELVEYLSGEGMSVRAIGQTVGADRNTVRSDLRQVGEIHPPKNDDLAPGGSVKADPREFFDSDEEMAAAHTMGEVTEEEFESALSAARADDDLSPRQRHPAPAWRIPSCNGAQGHRTRRQDLSCRATRTPSTTSVCAARCVLAGHMGAAESG